MLMTQKLSTRIGFTLWCSQCFSTVIKVEAMAWLATAVTCSSAADWPQFRGPDGTGLAVNSLRLPTDIGPEATCLHYKVNVPTGHSSPVLVKNRIYLTGIDPESRLVTLCLDRGTGRELWRQSAPYERLEEIHSSGSHATPTPAADEHGVVVFFGSTGLLAYDPDGQIMWQLKLGPFNSDFGSGTSPLIVENRVLLCQDHDTDSFLISLDRKTGEKVWRADRSEFPRNYCTPAIWTVGGRRQIVISATLRIVGYDFETGEESWTVRGVSRIVNMSPVVGEDGYLYSATWSPGAEANDRINTPSFDDALTESDRDGNQQFSKDELPEGPSKQRFTQIDRDKNGLITREEYVSMRRVFQQAQNAVLKIRPGGHGDITDTHVEWRYSKVIPYCPSPVVYRKQMFMIKNGGILTILDTRTGKALKEGRIDATGEYYSSPVAGDGKVYLLSQRGQMTVLSADEGWATLHTADFGENAYATPALVDGQVFVRTAKHLFCFGKP
ncbi:MAG: PQQ-binding-like beta-propeller repeat protein, partial [Planctomycetaceae bacterium]